MLKNATLYRIAPQWSAPLEEVEDKVAQLRFVPCAPTQLQSAGWVEPRGQAHDRSTVGRRAVDAQAHGRGVLPGPVVKRRIEEHAKRIEQETGRKPGKKMAKEIKEAVVLELLPQAFTKQSSTVVWIDPT